MCKGGNLSFLPPPFSPPAFKPLKREFNLHKGVEMWHFHSKHRLSTFDSLLAYLLCCVSTRQLLSLQWHPSTAKEKESPWLFVHHPGGCVLLSLPFLSPLEPWALRSLASLTRLPQSGGSWELFSIQVSGRKYIQLYFIKSLLKMPSLMWGYFEEELKVANFSPFPGGHVCTRMVT